MSIRFRAAADERFMRINEWVSDGHALVLLVSGLPHWLLVLGSIRLPRQPSRRPQLRLSPTTGAASMSALMSAVRGNPRPTGRTSIRTTGPRSLLPKAATLGQPAACTAVTIGSWRARGFSARERR